MQRLQATSIITIGLLLAAGCAKPDRGLMGYPKLRRSAPGGSYKSLPEAGPPKILPETHFAAGRVFEQQGSLDKAIEQYRKAVVLNHNYVSAFQRLGLVLSIAGRHDESLEAFTRAVDLKPDSAVLRNNLGFELLYKERWADAETQFREAVQLDPSLARPRINLAMLLARTGRNDESLAMFRTVLPEPDAHYNLGLVLRAQKQYEQAAKAFERVLELNPDFSAATQQLAQLQPRLVIIPEPAGETQDEVPAIAVKPAVEVIAFGPPSEYEKLAPIPGPLVEPVPAPIVAAPVRAPDTFEEFIEPESPPKTEKTVVVEPRDVQPESAKPTDAKVSVGWKLSLTDIARALDIVDNDRRCVDAVIAQSAAQVEARARAELRSTHEFIPIAVASHEPSTLANLEQEFVFVLPVTESRDAETDTATATTEVNPATTLHEESWMMLHQLESSLEIIRNEVDCQSADGRRPHPKVNPSDTIPLNIIRPSDDPTIDGPKTDSVDQPHPSGRTSRWNESFDGLHALMAIVENQSRCVAFEAMVARAGRASARVAAAVSFLPSASLVLRMTNLVGEERVEPCEPNADITTSRNVRVGLRSSR